MRRIGRTPVAARLEQENGDARAAIAAAPHTLSLDLDIERSASMPMEGRGTVARWDPDTGRLTVWTSTQMPFLVRGMGYYTGTIFEIAHPSSTSSLGGGGNLLIELPGQDRAARRWVCTTHFNPWDFSQAARSALSSPDTARAGRQSARH